MLCFRFIALVSDSAPPPSAACQADVALNDMLYDEATRQSSPLRYRTAETSQGGGCSGIRTEPIRALGFRPHASCAA